MNNTIDITEDFGTLYHPKSALVFYESKGLDKEVYVEHFDMDRNGTPINAHPLTEREAGALAKALLTEKQNQTAFLKSGGILPTTILHINPSRDKGAVLWYTKSQKRPLYFIDGLGIPSGQLIYRLWSGRRTKTACGYLPFPQVGDPRKKHRCTMRHFLTFMKTAGYVWVQSVLI
jgi:hypothetical protein